MIKDETSTGQTSSLTHYKNRLIMKVFGFFLSVFLKQEKEQELEQLTKELRQVNLQQFIQRTGTKVTVLPSQPTAEDVSGVYTHTHTRICKYTHFHAQNV